MHWLIAVKAVEENPVGTREVFDGRHRQRVYITRQRASRNARRTCGSNDSRRGHAEAARPRIVRYITFLRRRRVYASRPLDGKSANRKCGPVSLGPIVPDREPFRSWAPSSIRDRAAAAKPTLEPGVEDFVKRSCAYHEKSVCWARAEAGRTVSALRFPTAGVVGAGLAWWLVVGGICICDQAIAPRMRKRPRNFTCLGGARFAPLRNCFPSAAAGDEVYYTS